ncbi:MAG TPA: hypothetical protein VL486_08435 [Verrucomicrobiae bacterium]|nr:hypothetical protein [Verrucomicrobiae bacterium]
MNGNDDKLRALLRRWRDVEPQANFEAGVWRRIRQAETECSERPAFAEWLQRLLPRPVLATTLVVVASAVIGSSVGALSARGEATVTPGELRFLGSGTLAGGYVELTAGGTP